MRALVCSCVDGLSDKDGGRLVGWVDFEAVGDTEIELS